MIMEFDPKYIDIKGDVASLLVHHAKNRTLSEAILDLKKENRLKELLPFIDIMDLFEQEKRYHPEGNVFRHTIESLQFYEKREDYRYLSALAVLFHDVGKIFTQRIENGRIQYIGHEKDGADFFESAASILGFDEDTKNLIVFCIRQHMRYHHMLEFAKLKKITDLCASEYFPYLRDVCESDKSSRNMQSEIIIDFMDEFYPLFCSKKGMENIHTDPELYSCWKRFKKFLNNSYNEGKPNQKENIMYLETCKSDMTSLLKNRNDYTSNISPEDMSTLLFINKQLQNPENYNGENSEEWKALEDSFAHYVNMIGLKKSSLPQEEIQDLLFLLKTPKERFNKKYLFGDVTLNRVLFVWLHNNFFDEQQRIDIFYNCVSDIMEHKKKFKEYYKDTNDFIYEMYATPRVEVVSVLQKLSSADLAMIIAAKFIHSDAITDYSDVDFDSYREFNFAVYNEYFKPFLGQDNDYEKFFVQKEQIFKQMADEISLYEPDVAAKFHKEIKKEFETAWFHNYIEVLLRPRTEMNLEMPGKTYLAMVNTLPDEEFNALLFGLADKNQGSTEYKNSLLTELYQKITVLIHKEDLPESEALIYNRLIERFNSFTDTRLLTYENFIIKSEIEKEQREIKEEVEIGYKP